MSDEDRLTDAFERIAERTYGEETSGEEMVTIQEWHFTRQIGMEECAYQDILSEGEKFVERVVEDAEDPRKLVAGFALYTLAESANEAESSPPEDKAFY